eukprot:UN19683
MYYICFCFCYIFIFSLFIELTFQSFRTSFCSDNRIIFRHISVLAHYFGRRNPLSNSLGTVFARVLGLAVITQSMLFILGNAQRCKSGVFY